MLKLPGHTRYAYSRDRRRGPITAGREGKRLAFYIALNIEHFAFGTGIGMDPSNRTGPQTSRNFAWRDYGNRIGNWRLFEILDELKLPATILLNSSGLLPLSGDRREDQGSAATTCSGTAAPMPRCCAAMWEHDEARAIAGMHRGHREACRRAADRLDGPGRARIERHARPAQGGRLHPSARLAGR